MTMKASTLLTVGALAIAGFVVYQVMRRDRVTGTDATASVQQQGTGPWDVALAGVYGVSGILSELVDAWDGSEEDAPPDKEEYNA